MGLLPVGTERVIPTITQVFELSLPNGKLITPVKGLFRGRLLGFFLAHVNWLKMSEIVKKTMENPAIRRSGSAIGETGQGNPEAEIAVPVKKRLSIP